MKFYNPNAGDGFYQNVPHNGNHPTDTVLPFLVNCRESGFSKDFLVFAKDEAHAIANFLVNITALGMEIKKTLKPEDLLPRKGIVHSEADLIEAHRTTDEICRLQETLTDLDDKVGDLAECHREGIVENMEALRIKAHKLRQGEEKTLPSKFERIMERLTKLTKMTLTARQLDYQRAYAVAYFDDSRDYTSGAID